MKHFDLMTNGMMATATKQFETFLKKGAEAQRAMEAAIAGQGQGRAETPAAFFMIAVAQIAPSPTNPRKHFAQADLEELAASIREQGIQQPILVRKAAAPAAVHEVMDDLLREKKAAAKYEIVTGERRWRAAQLAKLETVPCLVREMDDRAALEAQIAENLQRKDITALEEGHAYRAWLAAEGERRKANGGERVTVDDLAARIGKSRRYVYDKLQLLDLGEAATKALEKGEITAAHASELVRLKPEVQERAMLAIFSGEVDGTRSLRTWIACERVKEEEPEKDPRKAANGAAGAAVRAATRQTKTPTAWTPAAIKREICGAIEERFGSDFRVARIGRARKAGEWLAVIRAVQAPAKAAKR